MTVSAELPPRKGLRVWDMIRVSFRVVGNFSSGDIVLEPFRTVLFWNFGIILF